MEKKSQMVGFMTTPEVKDALVGIAKEEDRSLSYIIDRILREHLGLTEDTQKGQENALPPSLREVGCR